MDDEEISPLKYLYPHRKMAKGVTRYAILKPGEEKPYLFKAPLNPNKKTRKSTKRGPMPQWHKDKLIEAYRLKKLPKQP